MNLDAQIFGGVKWTSLSTIVVTALHVITLVILARFLEPSDFGLMAIMMVVIGLSQAFVDMGISNAIIQRQDVTHSQLSSLYWLNVFSGFMVTLVVIFSAPFVAAFYEHPELTNMLQLLSVVFVIISIGNQYRILYQKEMQFDRLAIGEILGAFSAFSIAVIMAMNGFGVYALVYGMIAQACVSSVYFLYMGLRHHHRPSLHYKHDELKGYFSFGLYQMGEKLTNYLYSNIDNILIGKMLGMEALGFYNLAWQLCIIPVQRINPIIRRVAFPLYSKLQGDMTELNKRYFSFMRIIALIIVPSLVFLFFFSDELVMLVYGAGWEKTASLITFLSFVGILRALGSPGGSLVLAAGRADIAFWWTVGAMIMMVATVYSTLLFFPGLENLTFALLIYSLIFSVIWHAIIVAVSKVHYSRIISYSFRIICLSMIVAFCASFIVDMLDFDNHVLSVFSGAVICASIYFVYLLTQEKDMVMKIIVRKNT